MSMENEMQCERALGRFYRYLDDRDYAGLLALFHPEGIWMRQGESLSSHEKVLHAMERRSPTMITRHVVSNAIAKVTAADRVEVSAYLLFVRHETAAKDGIVQQPLLGVYTCNAEFWNTGGEWRIARLDAGKPALTIALDEKR
ncbi:nuclear transport factor 2 family protein [Paraburkholderia sediminicola]|uniref:nuclear transport factor 2 family protein n=1 Tax=Paraburkholderia sediminicola TaxID=458836 RepID=UPI0038BB2F29